MTAGQVETCAGPDLARIADQAWRGKALLVGIGNTMFGDDGAGPHLVQRLQGRTRAALLDVGQSPEAYLDKIADAGAGTVVLIDAVDFGSSPGTVAIFKPDQLCDAASGTHQIPLGLLIDYVSKASSTQVYLLGIQPDCTQLGADMSPAVDRSIRYLVELLSVSAKTGTPGSG